MSTTNENTPHLETEVLLETIQKLRLRLYSAAHNSAQLTDDDVLKLSKKLDRLVVMLMDRQLGAGGGK
jgi:hypothetical protein